MNDSYFNINDSKGVKPVIIIGVLLNMIVIVPMLFIENNSEGVPLTLIVSFVYIMQIFILSLSCTIDFNHIHFRISNIYMRQKFVEAEKFKKISSLFFFTNLICLIHFSDGKKYLFFSTNIRSPLEHPLIGNIIAKQLTMFVREKINQNFS